MPAVTPPRPGDTLVLAENDYRYGVGPVVVRVREVIDRVDYHAAPWWFLRADVANGSPAHHGGWVDRQIYVREAALPAGRMVPADDWRCR